MARKPQLKDSAYHLSRHELKKLIHAAPSFRDRCILKTFAQTAIRRFELTNLDIRDIDFDRQLIHIREGKGDKERTIPCSDDLIGDLRHLIGNRKKDALFQSTHGKAFSLAQINNIMAKTGRLAGVKNPNPRYQNINPHLLRHTFARLWKDSGRSIINGRQNAPVQFLGTELLRAFTKFRVCGLAKCKRGRNEECQREREYSFWKTRRRSIQTSPFVITDARIGSKSWSRDELHAR